MLYGLYLSATGLALNQNRQDVIANNLANVDTVAFKRDLAVFKQRRLEADGADLSGRFSPKHLRDVTGGAFVSATCTDWSSGAMKTTGKALDAALSGPGFFKVRDGDGVAYSRDGRFAVRDGVLVRATDGRAVLDVADRQIDVGESSPETLRIDDKGQLWNGDERIATIGIAEFEDPAGLVKLGGNVFQSSAAPVAAEKTTLIAGALESSGVDPTGELVELIKAARSFEIGAKMIALQDESLGRLISDLPKL